MGVLREGFSGNNSMVQTSASQVIEQIVNAIVSIVATYYLIRRLAYQKMHQLMERQGNTWNFIRAIASLMFLILFLLNRKFIKKENCFRYF